MDIARIFFFCGVTELTDGRTDGRTDCIPDHGRTGGPHAAVAEREGTGVDRV